MIERCAQNQSESAEEGSIIRRFSSLHGEMKDDDIAAATDLSFFARPSIQYSTCVVAD